MGLRLKVMPGVRIGLSTRGLRVSGGPRIARVHVGAGKTRVSSGLGPVSASTRLMPKKRRPSPARHSGRSAPPPPVFTRKDATNAVDAAYYLASRRIGGFRMAAMTGLAASAIDAVRQQRSQSAMEKEQARAEARLVVDEFQAQMLSMATAHQETFPAAQPDRIDAEAIRAAHVDEALRTTSALRPARRRERIAEAQQQAEAEIAVLHAASEARWHALLGNDPATVIDVLEAAFDDNQAPAVAVDCEGSHVTLVVTLAASVPEVRPMLTDKGKLETKAWPKGEATTFYARVAASAILATVKETWAACPSLTHATVVALRDPEQHDIPGLATTEVVYRGTFLRDAHRRVAWTHVDPLEEISTAEDVAFERKGRHKELRPLSLEKHPDLRGLLQDLEAAMSDEPEPSAGAVAPLPDSAGSPSAPSLPSAWVPVAPVPPTAAQAPGPGWHPDPWTAGANLRWWDGQRWSGDVHPIA